MMQMRIQTYALPVAPPLMTQLEHTEVTKERRSLCYKGHMKILVFGKQRSLLGRVGLIIFLCLETAVFKPVIGADACSETVVALDAGCDVGQPVASRSEPEIDERAPPASLTSLGGTITVAAVGDIILHEELLRQGFAHPDGFHSLWRAVHDLLATPDVTYANVEGPFGRNLTKTGVAVDREVDVLWGHKGQRNPIWRHR